MLDEFCVVNKARVYVSYGSTKLKKLKFCAQTWLIHTELFIAASSVLFEVAGKLVVMTVNILVNITCTCITVPLYYNS